MIDASVLLYFSFDSSLSQSRSMEQVVPAVHLTFYRLAVVIRDMSDIYRYSDHSLLPSQPLYREYSGVRPHKEKINISKEIINKTRGAVAPYAARNNITHLSVVSSRQRSYDWLRCEGLKNEMEM